MFFSAWSWPKNKKTGAKVLVLAAAFFCLALVGGRTAQTTLTDEAFAPIEQVATEEKKVAFTVNVDWGEENIPRMLELFQAHECQVTFFVTGKWAEKNPELLKTMAQAGHQIGNHGYKHSHPDRLPPEETKAEILKTQEVIFQTTGITTAYYAPPYGERGPNGLKAAGELGYPVIMWTLDTIDWREDSTPEVIVQRIIHPKKMYGREVEQKGAIILMHPRENTVAALPQILSWYTQNGFQMVSIENLIRSAASGDTIPDNEDK